MAQLTKITLSFDNGRTQDIAVGPQSATIQTPFGVVDLTGSVPKAPTGPEIAANPGLYDGDPGSDPTLMHAPQYWEGVFLPPYPPSQTMCDMARADITLAREVWRRNLGAPLAEHNLTAAQKRRCGL